MTNSTNNTNICPTCNDRELGPNGTCIICMEANSCTKHKELRDPIVGCMSCLKETDWDALKETTIKKKQLFICSNCNRLTQNEKDKYCVDCVETNRLEYMASVQAQADRIFEGKTKMEAIEILCSVANSNCLAMYDTWLYKYGVEKFGITRGDYYNDYNELTEEAKQYIGDNWKPLIENHLKHLTADLENDLKGIQSMSARFVEHIQDDKLHFLKNTAYYYSMTAELIEAVNKLMPKDGGKFIWEL